MISCLPSNIRPYEKLHCNGKLYRFSGERDPSVQTDTQRSFYSIKRIVVVGLYATGFSVCLIESIILLPPLDSQGLQRLYFLLFILKLRLWVLLFKLNLNILFGYFNSIILSFKYFMCCCLNKTQISYNIIFSINMNSYF